VACGRAPSRRALSGLAILLGASGLFLSGCGAKNGLNLTSSTPSTSAGVTIQGKVFGGQQPVSGSTIKLFAAGTGGYGSAPTSLLTGGSVTTDSGGNFNISGDWTCPAAPGDQVFMTATGGNPGGGVNNNLALMAALGSCSSINSSSFIVINEVSTVASVYSLAQFLSYTAGAIDQFPATAPAAGTVPFIGVPTSGASCNAASKWVSTAANSCNYVGLKNAMLTVQNLENISTGLPPANSKAASYGATITQGHDSWVPSARINTLANILSSCVNTTGGVANDGSNCGTLFGVTTPATTAAAPTDTLQALWNLAQQPFLTGANATSFFGLASKNAPFSIPAPMTAAPNDWTLALGFTSGGFTRNTEVGTYNFPTGALLSSISEGLAIDQQGNVWATSTADQSGTANGGNGALVGLNNQGVAITTDATAANWGGIQTNAHFPFGDPAIAAGGNLYFGNFDLSVAAVSQGGANVLANFTPSAAIDGASFTGIALDPTGNLWIIGSPGAGAAVGEYNSTGTTLLASNTTDASGASGAGFNGISLDATGHVWFSGGNQGFEVNTSGVLQHSFSTLEAGEMAVAANGNVYGCNTGILFQDTPAGVGTTFNGTAGCNADTSFAPIAVDGHGNFWMPVLGTAEASGVGHLNEVSSTGTTVSPATFGYQGVGAAGNSGSSTGEAATRIIMNGPLGSTGQNITGTAVDGSGNIWLLNGQADVNTSTQQIVEFVGLAAPAVTPKVLAVQSNSLGQLP